MVDRFDEPLLTPQETARHLMIPPATISYWLNEKANGEPLVHRVRPEKRGWPSMPFIAIVEAYVLRSLRDLGLTKNKIRDAATEIRRELDTPYALATKSMATRGIDIFARHAGADIAWDDGDDFAARLRLRQYPAIAPVVIDPRFGLGAPVVEANKVPVQAIVDLRLAGESIDDVADEYDMSPEQVEAICRTARAAA